MATTFDNKLKKFSTLSLTELNASASFLKRIDKKFLLNGSQLAEMLDDLKKDFQILEISGKKVFSYDNVYMDTDDYLFYNEHQEQKESRTKIRTRYYIDSNMAFFEYKQKDNGITQKYRYEFPVEEHGFMTKGKKRFFEGVWQSLHNGEKSPSINPSIKTKYKRITLVAKSSGERLTIDYDIKTMNLRSKKTKEINLKNLVIIESKSLQENCDSFKIMEKYGHKQASACSKYSLGVVYSGLAKKYDTFQKTMNKIEKIKNEIKKSN